jgi:hypothetical protein
MEKPRISPARNPVFCEVPCPSGQSTRASPCGCARGKKPTIAMIYKNDITFLNSYDDRIPKIAEVFKNKESFEARLIELRNNRNRHVYKFLSGEEYHVIIHFRSFIELARNIESFLTEKEDFACAKSGFLRRQKTYENS